MARRVGRPRKPWSPVGYSINELKVMLVALRYNKTIDIEVKSKLQTKIRLDIYEQRRLHKNYENAKARLFAKAPHQ